MHDIKWTYPKSDYRLPRPKQCCEFDIHKCCGRTRKTKITRELSFVPCEEIANVLFEDQMLSVLCSPTPAAFRDSRAFNWRMLHADALGQNNDRERIFSEESTCSYCGRAGAANPCFARMRCPSTDKTK